MKTNKSYSKRLKITKKGKIIARKPGIDHYNAKESRVGQLDRKRSTHFNLSKKAKARFLPYS
ncbi:50S ribosomal protein L35 [Patescibacteria group bacterium]|nr:50S ribosomal protein L35 [Patescibacteria group bacterium]